MSHAVLVAEDEETLAKNIAKFLGRHGYDVRTVADGRAVLETYEQFRPDLVLLDYQLPGIDGLQLLRAIRERDPQARVIFMTAHGNVQVAVDAMKAGAQDYVSKPLVLAELKLTVETALAEARRDGALDYYRQREASQSGLGRIIGDSPVMQQLKGQLRQLLQAERQLTRGAFPPVLIYGETGTGKELVARTLHFDGVRAAQPFIELNCAALPANLIESELFGYERGAFTDARTAKPGLAEAAEGGTLFLDEIGELELPVQAKLLRLLEDKTVRRVGSVRDRKVDIRVVAATHRDLGAMVADGRFRSDLFYRLRVVTLSVPSLRQRPADIPMLVRHFLNEFGRQYDRPALTLEPETMAALQRHAWPGNVRELRNVLEQAVLLSTGPIRAEHLLLHGGAPPHDLPGDQAFPSVGAPGPGGIEGRTLDEIERTLILRALGEAAWNVTRAAQALGISRDTLRYRMEKHAIARPPSSMPA